ncbi:MAG: hypothetical protein Q7K26_01255 [bacterium]|nr:hypothetical protein [bacterium]
MNQHTAINTDARSVVLTIDSFNNAAFDHGQRDSEITRVLREAANRIQDDLSQLNEGFFLRDVNGNPVGSLKVISGEAPEFSNGAALYLAITLGNDAFSENEPGEVSRIIREASKIICEGKGSFPLRDINGNTVGKLIISTENDDDDDSVNMELALSEGRVYFADSGYGGISDGAFRYAITHPDTPVGYHHDQVNVWLVNAKGEKSGDLYSVREDSLTELKGEEIIHIKRVINNEISLEDHELLFEDSNEDNPSM